MRVKIVIALSIGIIIIENINQNQIIANAIKVYNGQRYTTDDLDLTMVGLITNGFKNKDDK